MPQLLLDDAQFVARVTAKNANTFTVEEVVRGASSERTVRIRRIDVQPTSCCDREQHPVVAGATYWLIAANERLDRPRLLQPADTRVEYLRNLHDVTPAELRAIVRKWQDGGYDATEFSRFIVTVDVPRAARCTLPYYHRLLMDLTYIAWGNEDHRKCDADAAANARRAAAADALAALSFLETVRVPCVRSAAEVKRLPDLFASQVKRTRTLYPCMNPQATGSSSGGKIPRSM